MTSTLKPLNQAGNLGGSSGAVGTFDHDQFAGQFLEIRSRQAMAIELAYGGPRDHDSAVKLASYSWGPSCFHSLFVMIGSPLS